MKAYILTSAGPAFAEMPTPKPGASDVLVCVRAAALNRVDLAMSRGHVHGGAGGVGHVLGVEWAGEVVEVGAGVENIKPGDRVMCSGAGAFAQFAVADFGRVLPIPGAAMSYEQAAALPVALQTMHDAVVTHGALQPGQSVLIQGASSGVGLMALQIARARGAALVIGSSTDPVRRARLAECGAQLAVDSRDPGWVAQILEATGGKGLDLVVDQVSGATMNQTMAATRIGGRIVNVGRLGGDKSEFNFDLHAMRRLTYIGVTFRTRSRAEVREINRRVKADLWNDLSDGRLRLPIGRTFAFDAIADALAHMKANRHFGKIVVTI
ncbi:MAG TPA: zinc-binding dehydrogenase [Rhizomicrobium sp.]